MYTRTESVLLRIADVSLYWHTHSLLFCIFFTFLPCYRETVCVRISRQFSKRAGEKGRRKTVVWSALKIWNKWQRLASQHLIFFYLTSLLDFSLSLTYMYLSLHWLKAMFQSSSTVQKSLHSLNIRLIYTVVIRPLDLKQSGTPN